MTAAANWLTLSGMVESFFTSDYCVVQFSALEQMKAPADGNDVIVRAVAFESCLAWLNAHALLNQAPHMSASRNQYSGSVH